MTQANTDEIHASIEMQRVGNDEVGIPIPYEHQDSDTLTRTGKKAVLKVRYPR